MDKTEDTPLIEDYGRNVELSVFIPGELSPSSASRTSGAKSLIFYTVDDALNVIGVGTSQVAILCCMYVGMLAVYAQVLLKTTISDEFDCELKLTSGQSALVSTIFFIGEIASTYPVGRLIDTFGRKMGFLILSANLLYYGLILSVVPPSYPWVLFFRFLAGFFACGVQSTVVCYTGEMAPTKYRTAYMMGLLLSAGLGAIYISSVGFFVVPSLGWRWQAGLASLPSALILITVLFIPESPRYCALHGDLTKAIQILKHLADRRKKDLPVGELVQIEENKTERNFLHLLLPRTRRQTLSLWLVGIDPTGFILSTRGLTLGTYGILFLYAVEAYPTYTRAAAVTTCQFFAKGAGALTPFVAESYLVEYPTRGLIIYASICFIGAISGILLPFETAGRQLE